MVLGTTALVVGGSRGLGNALVKALHSRGLKVFTTVRGTDIKPGAFPQGVLAIGGIDLTHEGASAAKLVEGLGGEKLDLVIISAGFFATDTIDKMSWSDHIAMYTTCAIAPAFIASKLHSADVIRPGGRLLFVTTEGGSIGLRTMEEGGGNYGHHGSKAAANMVGKLLALDFAKKDVTVVDIHPGFMKTEMTANIGYDQFWESGGAVEPSEAAESMLDFAATLTKKDTGKFWAPRGPRDIGEAERVMGKNLPTPLELPW